MTSKSPWPSPKCRVTQPGGEVDCLFSETINFCQVSKYVSAACLPVGRTRTPTLPRLIPLTKDTPGAFFGKINNVITHCFQGREGHCNERRCWLFRHKQYAQSCLTSSASVFQTKAKCFVYGSLHYFCEIVIWWYENLVVVVISNNAIRKSTSKYCLKAEKHASINPRRAGGGCLNTPPPSNSAHGPCSDTQ